MKSLITCLLVFAAATSAAMATAQYPDKIWYEGKEHSLHTNPMSAFFEKHPEKKPESDIMSTALFRGYVATFEFKKDRLVLKDLEIQARKDTGNEDDFETEWVSRKRHVAGRFKELEIDWFTGILILPHGDLVDYVHMGYGSTFENYILLEVTSGKLTGSRSFDHKGYEKFKDQQFKEFKKTADYRDVVARWKKEGDSQKSIDRMIRGSVVQLSSEFLDDGPSEDTTQGTKQEKKKRLRPGRKGR